MLAVDPLEIVEIVLKRYRELPKAKQPTFLVHHLTARETLRYQVALSRAADASDKEEGLDAACEALGLALSGWRNVCGRDGRPVECDGPQKGAVLLADLLTMEELWELVDTTFHVNFMGDEDRKKSGWQLPSKPAESAPDAAAPAKRRRAKKTRFTSAASAATGTGAIAATAKAEQR